MSIAKNLIEYIETLENDSFKCWSEEQKKAYLTACESIKYQVYLHLTDFQKGNLKTLNEGNTINLTGIFGDSCDELLELHDLGLCESDEINILKISEKGKKLLENL